jgi:hypothetical protein
MSICAGGIVIVADMEKSLAQVESAAARLIQTLGDQSQLVAEFTIKFDREAHVGNKHANAID